MKPPAVVKVNIKLTDNHAPHADLFVEVDDATGRDRMPVVAFSSLKACAVWLDAEGYRYVNGTNGMWSNAH